MEVCPLNSLLAATSDSATASVHSLYSTLPKTALAETVKLLEVCSKENAHETDFCLAAASAVVQAVKDTEDGGKMLETLQACILDALGRVSVDGREDAHRLKSEFRVRSSSESKPEEESAFWCSCREVAAASNDRELPQFTAALETFSQRALRLVTSYLTSASRVLPTDGDVVQFLSVLCKQWWSLRVTSLMERGGLVQLHDHSSTSKHEVATSFSRCIKNLAAVHVVLSMQARISHCLDPKTAECAQPSSRAHCYFPLASDLFPPRVPSGAQSGRPHQSPDPSVVRDWLCSDALSPVLENLANTTPMVVYKQYQLWLETDQCVREGSTPPTVGLGLQRGKVFWSCGLLSSALTLLADVAASLHTQVLLHSFTGTITRLVNHYWQHLAEIIKRVPEELPLTVWYLALSSAIHLHLKLEEFEGILNLTSSQQEEFAQVIHSVGEFCNALREKVEDYHLQLCLTSVLHDAASHDWPNTKPFFENERCSLDVQMWHYHMQGLRHDLWGVGLEGVAGKILGSVLAASVSHLARRYTSVQPSYRRVPQFRADVLAILFAAASMLPCISPVISCDTTTVSDTLAAATSGEVATIHRSCAVLLGALTVGGSSLEQLVASLKPWQPDKVTFPSMSLELVEKWMQFLDLAQFGVIRYMPAVCASVRAVNELMAFVSLSYPKWELLLKLLLSRDGSLAVRLSQVAAGTNKGPFSHVALVLCHCSHRPQALSKLLVAMGDWTDAGRLEQDGVGKGCVMQWLGQLLRETLKSCMLARAGDFCYQLMRRRSGADSSDLSAEVLIPLLGDMEAVLRQLPHPLLNALRDIAAHITGPAENDSAQLAQLLALLIGRWLVVPPTLTTQLPRPLPSLLGAYCATVKHVLEGTPTIGGHADLHSLPAELRADLVQQLQKLPLALREQVKRFGSWLPRLPSCESTGDDVSDVGHETAAQTLVSNREALHSLKYLRTLLTSNKGIVMEMIRKGTVASQPLTPPTLTLPGGQEEAGTQFNPLKACLSLGNGAFDHQKLMDANVDWKNVLDNFALRTLGRDLVKQLVLNRFEFQDGAPLQGNEPESVLSVRSLFHSMAEEDCTI